MRYLLLIYNEEQTGDVPDEVMNAELNAYDDYSKWVREKSYFEGGEALQPTTSATTVRVRDGRTLTTDGPFAETKEALGGYYLLDCANLDEAIDAAARIPGARNGSIEIRPIWEFTTSDTAEAVATAG